MFWEIFWWAVFAGMAMSLAAKALHSISRKLER